MPPELTEILRSIYWRLIPKPVRDYRIARKFYPHWQKAGVVFIHVPKAAGTSMHFALYGTGGSHLSARDLEAIFPQALRELPSFALTRNPWDRCLSAYRFAKHGGGSGPNAVRILKPDQYNIPAFSTFRDFVIEWLTKQDLTKSDPVFRPQAEFICNKSGQIIPKHVGRIEEIEKTIKFLQEEVGLDVALNRLNQTSGHVEDYRIYYDTEMKRIVGRIYESDIDILKYRF